MVVVPKLMNNAAASHVSMEWNLKGPTFTVATACASSNHAMGQAFHMVRSGAATVMVTGAGGSIGSELCRQIAPYRPAKLVLLGRGENSIFEIQLHLRLAHPDLVTVPVVADVRDESDRKHPIRLVIELKRDGNADVGRELLLVRQAIPIATFRASHGQALSPDAQSARVF